jgi:hypothetical protein
MSVPRLRLCSAPRLADDGILRIASGNVLRCPLLFLSRDAASGLLGHRPSNMDAIWTVPHKSLESGFRRKSRLVKGTTSVVRGWKGARTQHFIGTNRDQKAFVVGRAHTRSAENTAPPGGIRHGYGFHHASHHRSCHCGACRRRLVRPGPLVLSKRNPAALTVASSLAA